MTAGCLLNSKTAIIRDDEYRDEDIHLPLRCTKVAVIDLRSHVDDKDIEIPLWTLRNQKHEATPPLTDEEKKLMTAEALSYFGDQGRKVEVEVRLLAGQKRYVLDHLMEKETSKTEFQIVLRDAKNHWVWIGGTAGMEYTVSSRTATSGYSEQIYQKTMKASIYKAMKLINDQIPKK